MKKRVLDGITVLDFSQVLAAPFCGMLLADLGADVIKVERLTYGDISREYGPYINDVSLYYCQYNRGKKSIAIDLRSEDGKNVIRDLVRESDIVIENYKAGTLDKLGIGYKELIQINPELIYGSISGFGLNGPLSHLPCMDIIAAARSGLIDCTGEEGGIPIKPGFSMCDTWAGLQLLRGLSMALLEKQRTGRATRVDIAMLDCAFYMCEWPVLEKGAFGTRAQKTGNHNASVAPHGEFTAKDGHIVLAVSTEDEWRKLCAVPDFAFLGADPLFATNADRLANRDALVKAINAVTSKWGRYELESLLRTSGVPGSAVQSIGEFIRSEQAKQLGIIAHGVQPGIGEIMTIGNPMKFSRTPVDVSTPAAGRVGEHTDEIVRRFLHDAAYIEHLYKNSAIQAAD